MSLYKDQVPSHVLSRMEQRFPEAAIEQVTLIRANSRLQYSVSVVHQQQPCLAMFDVGGGLLSLESHAGDALDLPPRLSQAPTPESPEAQKPCWYIVTPGSEDVQRVEMIHASQVPPSIRTMMETLQQNTPDVPSQDTPVVLIHSNESAIIAEAP